MTRHSERESPVVESVGSRKLAIVAVINLLGFVVELAGGLLFGSVALLSDAFHMLFDMLAYAMAFGASYTAENFQSGDEYSYGLHRLEPFAAFLNGVLLLPMVGYILYESYQRFIDPVQIDTGLTLVIAVGGLLVNLGSVYFLRGGEMSLNERGAFYHLLGDAGGSVAVIVSTIIVARFGLRFVDPLAAVLIGVLILWSAGKVLRESTAILLERSPISQDDVRRRIMDVEGIKAIEDAHVWQICSQLTVASITAHDSADSLDERQEIREKLHATLADLGIDHSTVELVESRAEPIESQTHDH